MLFLVEVNTKHRTNLNKLCMKNTTPHVGTLGQNFSSQVKSETYLKHYLHSPVEGIWNRFRNPILVWEFLKSLNFGRLETVEFRPETLEFRSDISNLGTFLEHFWQSWNFGPFGVSSSSQQRIWYKFESYPYEKTTPDAGDGWARISLFKF